MTLREFLIRIGLSILGAVALKLRAAFDQERLSWWLAIAVSLVLVFAGGWLIDVLGG